MRYQGEADDLLGKAYDSRVAKRLLATALPYRWQLVATVFLMLSTATADLMLPYLFGIGLDVVNPEANRTFLGRTGIPAINLLMIIFLVAIVFRFAAYFGQLYLTDWVGQRIVYDLRSRLFAHLQRLGIRYIDRRGVGSIMSRVQND